MAFCNTDEMEGIPDLSFDIRFEKIVIRHDKNFCMFFFSCLL